MSESHSLNSHYRRMGRAAFSDFRTASIAEKVLAMAGKPSGELLDVGCGSGVMPDFAWRRGWAAHGIDIAEAQVRLARELLSERGAPKGLVSRHTPHSLFEAGGTLRYRAITAMDVLEHVDDPVSFLLDLRRLMAPDGFLIVTVPAHPEFYDDRDRAIGHRERYTVDALREQLSAAGFRVEKVHYWNLLGWLHRRVRAENASREASAIHSVRYRNSLLAPILRAGLRAWFRLVENRITPPTGLTLIAVAQPIECGDT